MDRIYKLLIVFVFIALFIPFGVSAGEDIEIRAKLGINDGLKECRVYLYEGVKGYYKQMPVDGWRLVRIENGDTEMYSKYCRSIGYNFSDELLLPHKWVSVDWKFYYVVASIVIAAAFLFYALRLTINIIRDERKKD